jgi:hypothetical protein
MLDGTKLMMHRPLTTHRCRRFRNAGSAAWLSVAVIAAAMSVGGVSLTGSLSVSRADEPATKDDSLAKLEIDSTDAWRPLFDGATLGGWESTPFGGEGGVAVEKETIRIERGSELSGITWQKDFPTEGYAITLEASRVDGYDFFCGLTFPVGSEPCSFIVGGWGGGVVGLSSIDGADAAHNDTTEWKEFKTGTWYRITVEVSKESIRCWINDEQLVDQPRKGHEFSIRPEVFLSKPLGISCYSTVAALRDIRYRRLPADDTK